MSAYRVLYTKQAQKDARRLKEAGLKSKALKLLEIIAEDPIRSPPRYGKLIGNLSGAYSRRTTILHRLVYQVLEDDRVVKVLRMWTHYE